MNSLGVTPQVHRLYSDLADGQILLQLFDIIYPGIVDWKRVVKQFNKRRIVMEMIGLLNSVLLSFYVLLFDSLFKQLFVLKLRQRTFFHI